MADDLYTAWLNISAGSRPPDHYTLLGVERFCRDQDVIETAARARLTRLDQYAMHPDRDKRNAVQNMMDQVARARVDLVNPERQQAYDERLANVLGLAAPAPDVAQEPVTAPEPAAKDAGVPTNVRTFEATVWVHLGKWKLNPQEERLLTAEAVAMGLKAAQARRIIRRVDEEAEAQAAKRHTRLVRGLVGCACAVVLILVLVIVVRQWLGSEREERFATAISAARACLDHVPVRNSDLEEAEKELAEAAAIFPNDSMCMEVRRILNARRAALDERFAGILSEARALLDAGKLEDAARRLEQAEGIFPQDPRCTELAGLVAAKVEEREARFQAFFAEACRRMAENDFSGALEKLALVRGILPEDPRQARLREELLAKRKQLADTVRPIAAAVKSLLAEGRLDEAEARLAEAERSLPGDRTLALLRAELREKRFLLILSEAQACSDSKDFKAAKRKLDEAGEVLPGDPRAVEVREKVTAEEVRAKKLVACISEMDAFLRKGDLSTVAAKLSEARRLQPDEAKLGALLRPLRAKVTVRVSVAPDGSGANGSSQQPAISADGRYVAFESDASNLVPAGGNYEFDIFVHDCQTGKTQRVSVASNGAEPNDSSHRPAISADGRYVAFESDASNLVGDGNGKCDIFVHDCQTGKTQRVSVASNGLGGNGDSHRPAISADGRYVVFNSDASNLTPRDRNGRCDVFIYDRQRKTCELAVGVSPGSSGAPAISADGRYVAFVRLTTSNLVPVNRNGKRDIFAYDRQTDKVQRVSVASDGSQANGWSYLPAISADGRYVAFHSEASNLVPGDGNERSDIFIYDWQRKTCQRVRIGTTGSSEAPGISADGRYVAFSSSASDLVPGDRNRTGDIFVYDQQQKTYQRVSVASDGSEANDSSDESAISADGRYVAFSSRASNLTPGDRNEGRDIFVRDVGLARLLERRSSTSVPARPETRSAARLPANNPATSEGPFDAKETAGRQTAASALGVKKELALDLGGGVTMKLAPILAGTFLMGSLKTEKGRDDDEGPQHEVTISRPFYMGVTEVTQVQWKAVMGTEPWNGKPNAKPGADHAASYISWDNATVFCKTLSKTSGKSVRLPTEAEWEYACRSGSRTRFCYGDDGDYANLGDYAWFRSNAYDKGEKYAHAVGRKKPNAWGLHDMYGNAWEWCADRAGSYANAKSTDPKGPNSGVNRVLRGGGWGSPPAYCRSASHSRNVPVYRGDGIGFRVAVDLR